MWPSGSARYSRRNGNGGRTEVLAGGGEEGLTLARVHPAHKGKVVVETLPLPLAQDRQHNHLNGGMKVVSKWGWGVGGGGDKGAWVTYRTTDRSSPSPTCKRNRATHLRIPNPLSIHTRTDRTPRKVMVAPAGKPGRGPTYGARWTACAAARWRRDRSVR